MSDFTWQRTDRLVRNLTPLLVTVAVLLISLVPLRVPELTRIPPLLTLIALYHWTLFRPNLLPAYAVFGLGLLQDLLSGGPLGIQTMVLLLVYGGVLSQRRFLFGKSFAVVWMGFASFGLAAQCLNWLFGSILMVTLLPFDPFGYQYLLTVALFPFVSWLLVGWERLVLKET